MAKDYGIKIMKEGYDVTDTDIRNIAMSSKYSMLKFHSEETPSIVMHPGDTDQYVDVTHSLGYVPAFIAYFKQGGNVFNINALTATTNGIYVRADSAKIRCGWGFYSGSFNQFTFGPGTAATTYDLYDDRFSLTGFFQLGKRLGAVNNGAIRFENVTVPHNATIVSATLAIMFEFSSGVNDDLKIKTYGIAEDNTSDFNGSDPISRAQTTAFTTTQTNLSSNTRVNQDVKSIVTEITARSGWSSGNAMAFNMYDNGSNDGVYASDDAGTGVESNLTITYNTGGNEQIDFRVIIFKDRIA